MRLKDFKLLDFVGLRLPFWPHVRGIAFLLLAVPDFAGASYVYANFIRPCIKTDPCVFDTLDMLEEKRNVLIEGNEFFYDASRKIADNEQEKTSESVLEVMLYVFYSYTITVNKILEQRFSYFLS